MLTRNEKASPGAVRMAFTPLRIAKIDFSFVPRNPEAERIIQIAKSL